jgi:PAS domain S-box-containing protein
MHAASSAGIPVVDGNRAGEESDVSAGGAIGTTRRLMVLVQGALVGALAMNLLAAGQTVMYRVGGWLAGGFVAPTIIGAIAGMVMGHVLFKRGVAEEALMSLNEGLERRVRERTSELKRSNNDLKYEIGERRRADRALQETLIRQNAILDNIPDMAWLKDRNGTFLAVNEPFEKASGIPRKELIGKTDFDFWPEDLARRFKTDDDQVMKTGKRKTIEEKLVHTKDRDIWVETIKSPIFNEAGEVIGTTGIARDVTDRKRAETASRKG